MQAGNAVVVASTLKLEYQSLIEVNARFTEKSDAYDYILQYQSLIEVNARILNQEVTIMSQVSIPYRG